MEGAELSREFVEEEEVGLALLAGGEAGDEGEEAGFFVDGPEDFGDGAAAGEEAPAGEVREDVAESRGESARVLFKFMAIRQKY